MLRKKASLILLSALLLVLSISVQPPVSAEDPAPETDYWAGRTYQASQAYSTTKQGNQYWHYQDWNGATYQPMTYNASLETWQGREEWARIGFRGADKMHPGRSDVDSVRAFEAPVGGRVSVSSLIKKYDRNGGDGVRVKILHNDTQVWPATGWQLVPYNESVGIATYMELDVDKGDWVRFVLNQNGNISNDNTIWDPVVTYLSSGAPDLPAITGVEGGFIYREATAATWTDTAGTVSAATLRKDGGTAAPYESGTPIAESGRYELEVVSTRTSTGLTASAGVSFTINLAVGTGDWAGRTFRASDAYNMLKQGVGNWYYMDWDGTTYRYMGYRVDQFNAWQGRTPYSLIGWNGAETVHPGNGTDAVRVFRAPVDGDVIVAGNVRKRDKNGGDGVRAKILKNDVQIWPASGWQTIAYNDGEGYTVHLPMAVARGDEIRFILNQNGTLTNDSTFWDPSVTYVSSEAPELPVIEGVEDDGVYTSAVPVWTNPTGTTSSAVLSKDAGAPVPYTQATPITATGNYVLTVTAERTDGGQTYLASSQVAFGVGVDSKKRYEASQAFPAAQQGADHWYYRAWSASGYEDMVYSQQQTAWQSADGQSRIGAAAMLPGIGSDSVRVFKAPVEGNVTISGKINNPHAQGAAGAKAKILVNDVQIWPTSGWTQLAYNNGAGYVVNQPAYVYPGDEIRFVISSGGTELAGSLEWNPSVSYSADPLKQMLHFRQPSHYIGDVHPYYEDGTYYLFYLKPGTFEPLLATSTDMIHWETRTLTHDNPPPAQVYYALGIFKDGNTYRSYYGNFSSMKGSQSTDLLNWSNAPAAYDIANNMGLYAAGARDPYVFWDGDAGVYRMVSSAYRSKSSVGGLTTMDASIALTTTNGADLTDWGTQTDLIRFPNTNVPPGSHKDPEVAQMFKIGDRWYLMASIAGQSVHHVGKPTYWIGSPDTLIDQEDWQSKQAYSLEGEDLAAAQVFQSGDKWLMLGWIPQQATGNAWGGHLSLPREVYPLADGRLAAKLESAIGAAIRGDLLYDSASSALPIAAETGSWQQVGADITSSGTGFGIAKLPGTYDRIDMEMDISLDGGASRAGLLLDKDVTGPYGYEISLNNTDGTIRIRRDATGSGGWVNFADLQVGPGSLSGVNKLRLIAEGDILELFVNDKYALSARITSNLTASSVRLFASGGAAEFSDIRIHALKSKSETVIEPVSQAPALSLGKPGTPYLADDNGWYDSLGQDGDYTITMNMWYGDNGQQYRLYENGVLIDTRTLTDDAPNAQTATTAIRGRPNGTYRYVAELSNAFGTTQSAEHVVEVVNAAPGKPVLSNDNWDRDGEYLITMNMWWGTNGTSYRLYENNSLIAELPLTAQSPGAQSAVVHVQDKPPGSYTYRGELINAAGAASSEEMVVVVAE